MLVVVFIFSDWDRQKGGRGADRSCELGGGGGGYMKCARFVEDREKEEKEREGFALFVFSLFFLVGTREKLGCERIWLFLCEEEGIMREKERKRHKGGDDDRAGVFRSRLVG